MSKLSIGIIFLTFAALYGLLLYQPYYNFVARNLLKLELIKPQNLNAGSQSNFTSKPQIIFYTLILIAFGIWMIVSGN